MATYLRLRQVLLSLLVCMFYMHTSAQTFFGISSSPVDNGTQAGPTVTVTPPVLMQTGDLAVVYVQYRGTGITINTGNTGGQSWTLGNTGTTNTGSNHSLAIFWCRFNGTWSANPTFTIGSGTGAMTAVMYVYRPSNSSSLWGVHIAQNNTQQTNAAQTVASISTTLPKTVSMAFVGNSSTNTWTLTSGTGWTMPTFPLLANQIRNTSGSSLTHSAAYNIQSNPTTLNAVTLTQSSSVSTGRTYMSWYELSNDNCINAIPVTVNTGAACSTTTTATTLGATQSIAGCNGTADDDVWFSFVATNNFHTITATGGNAPLLVNPVIEVFNSCGGTSLLCSNSSSGNTETATIYELTIGATYYYRVYSNSNGTGQGSFTTCVATPAAEIPANVATGKSFINITRPGGGTIVPGDELEIRVSVNVSNAGTNTLFRLRYNDTLPSNLTYVPGSLKLLTNEGKQYAAYTDAAGDDAAMYNAVNRTLRFNLGRDTANMARGVVSSTATDSSSGGYVRSTSHAPRGNGMLVLVTYRVTVDASTSYNTIINYGPGALRYRNMLNAGGANDFVLSPNSLSFIIYPNYGLCSNATGANNVNAGNGNFGSGTSHNGPNPGAAVPGYTYLSITTGAPNDGMYSVVKNLSPSQSTNPFVARPENPNVDRVFRVWDIIGDHTGATDPLAGNPPSPSGATGGYMLAVNAAYQLSIANNQTITGLCENTYYEFSAWFRNVCKRCGSDSLGRGASNLTIPAGYIPTASGDSSGVKPNLTFMINGVDYYTSGDMDYIGNYGQWVKKGFVFLTAPGQTSLTISIKNNAPGGGGNDWVMDDISFATCLPSLTMRPTNSPTYCKNNQVDISVAVSTFFNNYSYYQWERSTDGGSTWGSAPERPGQQTFNFTNYSGEYRDTAFLPSFVAGTSYDGYKYRIRVGTTNTNLTSGSCALYNDVDIITINVSPSCDVLPVEILQWNAQLKDNFTTLFWKAKQEINLIGYTIERSSDGMNFKVIGTMPVKGALANEEQYFFRDNEPVYGKVYYRLRLSAVGGGTKFSNVLAVQPGNMKLFAVTNMVNPVTSQLTFQVTVPEKDELDVQLFDATGRFITNKKLAVNKGSNAIVFDVPSHLQTGSYLVRIISKYGQINKAIQKK